ncbi:MAG: spore maturation protein [Clostridia bacterium]|nr:spore maturation protein [Clostridia bacterium]
MALIIPIIFIIVFVFALIKKVNIYDGFTEGIKSAFKFTVSLLPCLAAIFMMCAVFEVSGLADRLCKLLSPVFGVLGIPPELTKLVLIKPFSGSGSLAYLNEIIEAYGADSYIARCACVCFGSSETVFYISAVYFAEMKVKKLAMPIACVLVATLITTIVACLICKVI